MLNDNNLDLRKARENKEKTDKIAKKIEEQEEVEVEEKKGTDKKNGNRPNNNSQIIAFLVFNSKLIIFTETQFLKNRRNA